MPWWCIILNFYSSVYTRSWWWHDVPEIFLLDVFHNSMYSCFPSHQVNNTLNHQPHQSRCNVLQQDKLYAIMVTNCWFNMALFSYVFHYNVSSLSSQLCGLTVVILGTHVESVRRNYEAVGTFSAWPTAFVITLALVMISVGMLGLFAVFLQNSRLIKVVGDAFWFVFIYGWKQINLHLELSSYFAVLDCLCNINNTGVLCWNLMLHICRSCKYYSHSLLRPC